MIIFWTIGTLMLQFNRIYYTTVNRNPFPYALNHPFLIVYGSISSLSHFQCNSRVIQFSTKPLIPYTYYRRLYSSPKHSSNRQTPYLSCLGWPILNSAPTSNECKTNSDPLSLHSTRKIGSFRPLMQNPI